MHILCGPYRGQVPEADGARGRLALARPQRRRACAASLRSYVYCSVSMLNFSALVVVLCC